MIHFPLSGWLSTLEQATGQPQPQGAKEVQLFEVATWLLKNMPRCQSMQELAEKMLEEWTLTRRHR